MLIPIRPLPLSVFASHVLKALPSSLYVSLLHLYPFLLYWILPITYLFLQQISLSVCYVSCHLQGTGDKAVKERNKVSIFMELSNMLRPHMLKQIKQHFSQSHFPFRCVFPFPSPSQPNSKYLHLHFLTIHPRPSPHPSLASSPSLLKWVLLNSSVTSMLKISWTFQDSILCSIWQLLFLKHFPSNHEECM